MTSWKKSLYCGVALTLTSSLLVACGSKSTETTTAAKSDTLKLWVPTGAKASYQEVVSQFEKDSGYKVKIIESEDPKAQEKIKKDASTAADVFSLPHDQLGQFVP